MRIKFAQEVIDKLRGKKSQKSISLTNSINAKLKEAKNLPKPPQDEIDELLNDNYDNIQYKQIVSTTGFYYSGSSVVLGLLAECNNATAFGNAEIRYTKQKIDLGKEVKFLSASGLFEFLECVKSSTSTPCEKDARIKTFISNVYKGYNDKNLVGHDRSPLFFNDNFLKISLEFLDEILDLNDFDKNVLLDKPLPTKTGVQDCYKGCSFMHGEGMQSYVFYKIKELPPSQIDKLAFKYITRLFNTFKTKEFLVLDQLLRVETFKKINSVLMDSPIKMISVVRDPRDQFLSAFRADASCHMPRTPELFSRWYQGRVESAKNIQDDNHLMIRFEDLVLKYDETVKKVFDFVGIDPKNHTAPKSIFDPAISVQNIGAWKDFHDQEFMRQIEERLSEYCYYPEKENLSDEAKKLLENRG